MCDEKKSIGIFDSGVGGVSVLKELLALLPHERFVYYADSANAPYGSKGTAEVECLSLKVANYLIKEKGVKALIVACNTATSAAIKRLRQEFAVPIIGMEPAVKPAVEIVKDGQILAMATPMTLREAKFQQLLIRYENGAKVIPLPCTGLVELIEAGITKGEKMRSHLRTLFNSIETEKINVIVLGCTHYIFARDEIASFFSPHVSVVDGNQGTIRQAQKLLEAKGLLAGIEPYRGKANRVEWCTSGNLVKVSTLCQSLLK